MSTDLFIARVILDGIDIWEIYIDTLTPPDWDVVVFRKPWILRYIAPGSPGVPWQGVSAGDYAFAEAKHEADMSYRPQEDDGHGNVDEHSGYSQADMDAMSDEFSGSFGLLESYQDQEYDLDAIGIESTDDLARQESEAEARYQDTLADAREAMERMMRPSNFEGYRPDLEADAEARFQDEYVRLKRTETPSESISSEEPTVGRPRCTCITCLIGGSASDPADLETR